MIYIDFTEQQKEQIKLIARNRDQGKTTHEGRYGMTSLQRHEVGAWGEMACRVYMDAWIDTNSYGNRGDGGKPDCYINNIPGQIKTGRGLYKDCWISNRYLKKMKSEDLIILCWRMEDWTGYIKGITTKEHILSNPKVTIKEETYFWKGWPRTNTLHIVPHSLFSL